MIKVKVSNKMAKLKFAGCDPEYIKNVCKASCCQSSVSKTGTMITIHPEEQDNIIGKYGVKIENNLLQPKDGQKRCPFKTNDNLCGIHYSGDKPFGCIASPFTLNKSGTLIVRNRYKLLKCYDDGNKIPAYIAFRASLDLIFGESEAERLCNELSNTSDDVYASMSEENYNKLVKNDEIKKENK
jgi:hypothetical protein